ncbi:MAG: hypothetical protein Q7K43_01435, partial [Candidatus Woesearchaeota archaeon]|nr:hypothetical protein [Candidatus Woesearchaeota archaeon]
MNNRGMSPLIATVILIAFSVLLGAIVMSWGEKYIEEKADFANNRSEVGTACETANLDLVTIQGLAQICQRGERIEATLETAQQPVWDVHARIIGDTNTLSQESLLTAPIAAASATKTVIYSTTAGTVLQVKLTPKAKEGKNIVM